MRRRHRYPFGAPRVEVTREGDNRMESEMVVSGAIVDSWIESTPGLV